MSKKMISELQGHTRSHSRLRMPLAAATAAILLTAAFAQPAVAAEPASLPTAFVDEVTSVWTEHGVDGLTQTALLEKLESGTSLDAMTDATPVSISTVTGDTDISTVNTYADGSINVLTLEKPTSVEPDGLARGISGCSGGGTSNTYTNCSVNGWFTGVALAFFASYYLSQGNARITAYSSGTKSCSPGVTCSDPTFEVIRLQQSGTNAARVNLVSNWSYVGIGGGGTTRLALTVINFSATTN